MQIDAAGERRAHTLVLRRQVLEAVPAALLCAACAAVYHTLRRLGARWPTLGPALALLMSPYMITSLVAEPVRRGLACLYAYLLRMLTLGRADDRPDGALEAARLRVLFEQHSSTMSKRDHAYAETYLKLVEDAPQANPAAVQRTCAAVHTALTRLPKERRALDGATVRAALDPIVAAFSPQLQYSLRLTARGIVADSTRHGGGRPRVLYFLGAPGTAKTRTAHALAGALGLPLVPLDIDHASFPGFAQNSGDRPMQNPTTTTPFCEMLLGCECTNAVVFIDEADKVLNVRADGGARKSAFLLRLFDGDPVVLLPELNYPYDASGHTFVLTGNQALSDEALRNRVTTITFDGFGIRARDKIARERFAARSPGGRAPGDDWVDQLNEIVFYETDTGIRSMLGVVDQLVEHINAHLGGWVGREFDVPAAYARVALGELGEPGPTLSRRLEALFR